MAMLLEKNAKLVTLIIIVTIIADQLIPLIQVTIIIMEEIALNLIATENC
jgi:hypothetical protein